MKKPLLASLAIAFFSSPAWATGNIAVSGSYWNTQELDWGGGAGVKFGVPLGPPEATPFELEFRGTYYRDLSKDDFLTGFDFKVRDIPLEVGLKLNLAPKAPVNWYLGGGGSYHFLHTNIGNLSNEVGYYALFGFEAGQRNSANFFAEGMYRKINGTVEDIPATFSITDRAALQLKGFAANAGIAWRF